MALTKLNSAGVIDRLPTGSVLQTVQSFYATEVPNNSASYVDTGLTATIIPTSSSSKILIIFSVQQFLTLDTAHGNLKLVRGSTDLRAYGFQGYAGSSTLMCQGSHQYLDAPSSTSALTYKVQFNSVLGGKNIICQYDDSNADGTSSMLLQEIKG